MPAFEYHATVTVRIRNGKRFKLEVFRLPMGRRGQLMLRCDGKNSRHGQTTCTDGHECNDCRRDMGLPPVVYSFICEDLEDDDAEPREDEGYNVPENNFHTIRDER